MVRDKPFVFAAAAALCMLVSSGVARAQDAGAGAVHMPEPLEVIQPEYPPEAATARLEATVVLRVSIDAEGNVTEAEVIGPRTLAFLKDDENRGAIPRGIADSGR